MRYDGRTRSILIGHSVWDGSEVYYTDRKFGVTFFLAKSRYGKTALAKHIVVKVSKYRPILVFDYLGEWKGIGEYNWRSPYPDKCEDLTVLENFGFKISDFTSSYWWSALGFAPSASDIISYFANLIQLHYDDPRLFEGLLSKLPTSEDEVGRFNTEFSEFGIPPLPARFAEPSITSIKNTWSTIKDIFIDPNNDDGQFHITDWEVNDWGQFFYEHPHLIINLQLNRTDYDKFKARILVGRILQDIAPYLSRIKPLIILEEGDVLAPSWRANISGPSLDELIEYSKKYQKMGVSMIYICQDQRQVNEDCYEGHHQKIMGLVPRGNEHFELTEKLRWYYDSNYREFVMVDASGRYVRFVPIKSCCKVW